MIQDKLVISFLINTLEQIYKKLILEIAKNKLILFVHQHMIWEYVSIFCCRKIKTSGFDSLKKTELIHHKDKFKSFVRKSISKLQNV